MIILSQQEISATPKGADKLSPEQVAQLMPQLPEWTIITIDTIEQLYRAYSLKDFNAAISFSNKIAAIADNADHHPTLSVQWGTLAVYWWSTVSMAYILMTSSWRRKLMRSTRLYDY